MVVLVVITSIIYVFGITIIKGFNSGFELNYDFVQSILTLIITGVLGWAGVSSGFTMGASAVEHKKEEEPKEEKQEAN